MKIRSVKTIGIIGLGLIGTSIGMALKKSNPSFRVKGLTRSKINGEHALEKKAVDCITSRVTELLDGTDLVILATPVRTIITLLSHIGTLAKAPLLVTDTGSTKEEIEKATKRLPSHVSFIGGHPLAGKEVSGAVHADADLFVGRPWVLIPTPLASSADIETMKLLVSQLGAKPLMLSAADHDRMLSAVSHLPFVISSLLMEAILTQRDWPRARMIAGSGFRDTTRLAGGNPTMHVDILRTNRAAILGELSRFEEVIRSLKHDLVTERWSAIKDRLTAIQKARLDWERSQV